jgi:hypothetical protein
MLGFFLCEREWCGDFVFVFFFVIVKKFLNVLRFSLNFLDFWAFFGG